MNQGKLELVKQEMARVNISILGISKLKCTGMGEFNSDDNYIYHCGQESLKRNAKNKMTVWGDFYKYLRKEEKRKAEEKRKDINI